ncbi:hypothetical protein B0H14DRAFT_2556879 [Mycena olivaceomarginata]|nr:hypothetical protein B0H14DRAFT_2556879 [Mycena olivaceomarginata]
MTAAVLLYSQFSPPRTAMVIGIADYRGAATAERGVGDAVVEGHVERVAVALAARVGLAACPGEELAGFVEGGAHDAVGRVERLAAVVVVDVDVDIEDAWVCAEELEDAQDNVINILNRTRTSRPFLRDAAHRPSLVAGCLVIPQQKLCCKSENTYTFLLRGASGRNRKIKMAGADDVSPGLTLLATTAFMDHASILSLYMLGFRIPLLEEMNKDRETSLQDIVGKCWIGIRHTSTPEEFWRTEMLIAEEELGHTVRVLLIQLPEDIEALNRIYTYIANVVLPHATNSQEIYDTLTAAEPGDNWGDEQDTALVDQLFEQLCFPQTCNPN